MKMNSSDEALIIKEISPTTGEILSTFEKVGQKLIRLIARAELHRHEVVLSPQGVKPGEETKPDDVTRNLMQYALSAQSIDPAWGEPFEIIPPVYNPSSRKHPRTENDLVRGCHEGTINIHECVSPWHQKSVTVSGAIYKTHLLLKTRDGNKEQYGVLSFTFPVENSFHGDSLAVYFDKQSRLLVPLMTQFPLKTKLMAQETNKVISSNEASAAMLARVDMNEGKLQSARLTLEAGLKSDPESPYLQERMIELLTLENNNRQAIDYANALVKYDPKNAGYWGTLGELHLKEGEYKQAIEPLEKTLILAPNEKPVLTMLGKCYFLTGNYDRALPVLLNAIQSNIDRGMCWDTIEGWEIWRYLGDIYSTRFDNKDDDRHAFDYACIAYKNAISLERYDYHAWVGLAKLYQKHNEIDRAINMLEQFLRLKIPPAWVNETSSLECWESLRDLYRSQKDWVKMKHVLQKIIEHTPDEPQHYLDLVLVLKEQEDYAEIRKVLKKLETLKVTPQILNRLEEVKASIVTYKIETILARVETKHKMGDIPGEIKSRTELAKIADSWENTYELGNLYFASQKWDLALSVYDSLLPNNLPNEISSKIWFVKAQIHAQKGLWDECRKDVAKVATNHATIKPTWERLAEVFHNSGNLPASLECYKILVHMNPNEEEYQTKYFNALIAALKLNDAISILEKLHQNNPRDTKILHEIAKAKETLDDVPGALQKYDLIRSLDNHDVPSRTASIRLLAVESRWDQVINVGNELATFTVLDLEIKSLMATAYHHLKNWEAAASYYQQVLSENVVDLSKTLEWHRALGHSLLKMKKYADAIPHLEYVIRKEPRDAAAWYMIGKAYCCIEQWKYARDALKQAIKSDDKRSSAWTFLGAALAYMGSFDEAKECFQKALSLNPKKEKAERGLARVLEWQGIAGPSVNREH